MADGPPIVAVTRRTPVPVRVPEADVRTFDPDAGRPDAGRAATRDELLDHVRGSTAIISMFHDRIDPELLDAAGPTIRGVCNHAVGYDNVDIDACRDRGVAVCNTPDAVTEGTANLAWLLIMACARQLIANDRFVRSGKWAAHGPLGMHERLGLELAGRTILIVGAGRIGLATALRAHAFGMRTRYVARTRKMPMEVGPLAARRVELHEGLRAADVVSVHAPLTPQTRHLIGRAELEAMKPEAILVSTARGPVIDQQALIVALTQGRLWGVGLDVFEHEPHIPDELIACDRVVMTPHIGSGERRFRAIMTEMTAASAAAIVAGQEPPYRVA